jgi:hypothetical protein
VADAKTCAIVSVEILREEDVIDPMWVLLKFLGSAIARTLTVRIA